MMLATALLALMIVATIHGFGLYLQHKERLKWMQMISLRRICPCQAEVTKPIPVHLPTEQQKKRFSIPVPGGDMFRRAKGN